MTSSAFTMSSKAMNSSMMLHCHRCKPNSKKSTQEKAADSQNVQVKFTKLLACSQGTLKDCQRLYKSSLKDSKPISLPTTKSPLSKTFEVVWIQQGQEGWLCRWKALQWGQASLRSAKKSLLFRQTRYAILNEHKVFLDNKNLKGPINSMCIKSHNSHR
jgi:hypothetical protein